MVVLGHGFGSDRSVWDPIVARYARRAKRLTFDLDYLNRPTCGSPPHQTLPAHADDLMQLMLEVELRDAWYVGHSVGGMIGALASLAHGCAFSRLVLLNVSPRYLDDVDYVGGFTHQKLDQLYADVRRNYEAWVLGFAPAAAGDASDGIVADFAHSLTSLRPDIALSVLRMDFESDLREILPVLDAEVTLIHTRRDFAVPGAVADHMAAHIRQARRCWLETVGHMPHVTAPDLTMPALDDALFGLTT